MKLSPATADALVGYGMGDSVLSDYGDLTMEEFKKVLAFLQTLYQENGTKNCLGSMEILVHVLEENLFVVLPSMFVSLLYLMDQMFVQWQPM